MSNVDPSYLANQNVLFGTLAAQKQIVSPLAAIEALREWVRDHSQPVAEILLKSGKISPIERNRLELLVEEQLRAPESSLAATQANVSASDMPATWPTLNDHGNYSGDLAALLQNSAGSRYRTLQLHARGGLGEVYIAEDTELHRKVALKEIQLAQSHNSVSRARFIAEAEITGNLEHPGIVPVYGLGTHSDGRPYYAMRFIQGHTLADATKSLHGQRLTDYSRAEFRQLLRQFINVCNAIAYAHSRGIIHRDIKPHNVMIGPYGETLVVDWGLAKVIGQPDLPSQAPSTEKADREFPSSAATPPTRSGQFFGTPAFMSPEQAGGKSHTLGPPSDVYSLGATLYVLLTGQTSVTGSGEDAIHQVETGNVPTPRSINPHVPGPLDSICHKAMALDPADRYQTPLTLAADLERWLADEPVSCHRDSFPVRMTRWGKRHKTWVVASAALLLTALAGLTIGLWALEREQVQTARERDEKQTALEDRERAISDKDRALAERGAALAEKERAFSALAIQQSRTEEALRETTAAKDASLAQTMRARDYLRTTVNFALEKLLATNAPRTLRDDQSLSAMVRYADELRQTVAETPEKRLFRAEGAYWFAYLHAYVGQIREAIEAYTEAVQLYRGLVAEQPQKMDFRERLSGSHSNLARNLRLREDPTADQHFLEALKVIRETDWSRPDANARFAIEATATFSDVATLHATRGRNNDARKAIEELLKFRRDRINDHPEWKEYPGATARHLQVLARRTISGDLKAEAEQLYHDVRETYEHELKVSPTNSAGHSNLAVTLTSLGTISTDRSDLKSAARLFEMAEYHFRTADRLNRMQQLGHVDRMYNRVMRCEVLIRLKDHATVAKVAEQYKNDGFLLPGEDLATGAGLLAQCVTLAEQDEQLTAENRAQITKQYADRAMELLVSAVENGFRNVAMLKTSAKYQPLKTRADFAELIMIMEERSKPKK